MNRFDITLGLLAILGAAVVTALVALGEPARMPVDELGFQSRKVENGAVMFAQYCANCHGPNASGGVCPPLDHTSGLHGGDLGDGIAWRLEDLGWDPAQPYEYVSSVIGSGRNVSTRPDQYPGNRTSADPSAMAMPAWSQSYGGPLRPDQIDDLTSYIVAFRDAVPTDATPRPSATPAPTARPTRAALGAGERVTTTAGITVTEGVTGTEALTGTTGITPTRGAATRAAAGAATAPARQTPRGTGAIVTATRTP